jgi:hypothetical protein
VDIDEVIGDQGREDAFEQRLMLLREGVPGTSGVCSGERTVLTFGRFGVVGLTVGTSGDSTFVELFHGCFSAFCFMVEFWSTCSKYLAGEVSGVRL